MEPEKNPLKSINILPDMLMSASLLKVQVYTGNMDSSGCPDVGVVVQLLWWPHYVPGAIMYQSGAGLAQLLPSRTLVLECPYSSSPLLFRWAAQWLGAVSRRSHSQPSEFMGSKWLSQVELHQLHKSSPSSYKSQAICAKMLTESFWLVGWLVGPTAVIFILHHQVTAKLVIYSLILMFLFLAHRPNGLGFMVFWRFGGKGWVP